MCQKIKKQLPYPLKWARYVKRTAVWLWSSSIWGKSAFTYLPSCLWLFALLPLVYPQWQLIWSTTMRLMCARWEKMFLFGTKERHWKCNPEQAAIHFLKNRILKYAGQCNTFLSKIISLYTHISCFMKTNNKRTLSGRSVPRVTAQTLWFQLSRGTRLVSFITAV